MTQATLPTAFEPDAYYEVKFARVIEVGGMKLRPAHSYRLLGRVLADMPADALASAILVTE